MHKIAERLLALLETRRGEYAAFDKRIDKYEHSLQCATRALYAKEPDDYVVMCLFHDVFGGFEALQHGNMAGVVLRPWISTRALIACYEHPLAMQELLSAGDDWHVPANDAMFFAQKYDHPSFDPKYIRLSLNAFLPIIQRVIR